MAVKGWAFEVASATYQLYDFERVTLSVLHFPHL